MKEKVLLVFDKGLGYGGVESVIMSIVRGLSNTYTFDLLTNVSCDKAYDKEFKSYGGKILRVPFYEGKSRFWQRADYYIRGAYLYRSAKEIIKDNMPYRAIHCNNSCEGGIILAAAKKAGIAIRIMHSHAVFEPDKGMRGVISGEYKKLIAKNATAFVGCSENAMGLFPKNEKHIIICNCFNSEKFRFGISVNPNMNQVNILQVGRYDRIKNQKFSLYVFKKILAECPNATLSLVGSTGSEEETALVNLAKDLGILEKVFFCKASSDIAHLLCGSDVFLFPSLAEGFGIALIEAQAMGVKCYASDAVPTITNCGGVDYLPLSIGADAWAKRIIDDFLCGKCQKKHYDCSKFSSENIIAEYKKLYEESI